MQDNIRKNNFKNLTVSEVLKVNVKDLLKAPRLGRNITTDSIRISGTEIKDCKFYCRIILWFNTGTFERNNFVKLKHEY